MQNMVRSTTSMTDINSSITSSSHKDILNVVQTDVDSVPSSVFTISDETYDKHTEQKVNHGPPKIHHEVVAAQDAITKPFAVNNTMPSPINPNILPPIVIHQATGEVNGDARGEHKITAESVIAVFGKNLNAGDNGGGEGDEDGSVDFADTEMAVRKMSCCYGCAVFLGLFLGLAALTCLVIYAGFWYLLQMEGRKENIL